MITEPCKIKCSGKFYFIFSGKGHLFLLGGPKFFKYSGHQETLNYWILLKNLNISLQFTSTTI